MSSSSAAIGLVLVSGGETVISFATCALLARPPDADRLEPALVKGPQPPVAAHRAGAAT